jgi:hypothetical protein
MSKEEAFRRLEKACLPDPLEETSKIQAIFGPIADELLPTQKDIIDMSGAQFEALKARIVDHWQEVHAIAASVPPAEDFTRWLRLLGGPVDGGEINLSTEEVRLAKDYSHYLRRRFSINKLRLLLGIS